MRGQPFSPLRLFSVQIVFGPNTSYSIAGKGFLRLRKGLYRTAVKAYCRSKTGDGDAWVFWYYQFALSHIHRYPSIPNECRYCSAVGLLKEFKRAPPSPPTLVRSAGCEADGRKTEYLKWNTAHCRCPVNVVECRRTFQRSASRQSTEGNS